LDRASICRWLAARRSCTPAPSVTDAPAATRPSASSVSGSGGGGATLPAAAPVGSRASTALVVAERGRLRNPSRRLPRPGIPVRGALTPEEDAMRKVIRRTACPLVLAAALPFVSGCPGPKVESPLNGQFRYTCCHIRYEKPEITDVN